MDPKSKYHAIGDEITERNRLIEEIKTRIAAQYPHVDYSGETAFITTGPEETKEIERSSHYNTALDPAEERQAQTKTRLANPGHNDILNWTMDKIETNPDELTLSELHDAISELDYTENADKQGRKKLLPHPAER